MLSSVCITSQPRIDKWLLNVNRPHLWMLGGVLTCWSYAFSHRRTWLLPQSFLLLTNLLFRLTLPWFLLLLLVSFISLFLLKCFLLHFLLLLHLNLSFPLFISFLLFNQCVADLFGQVEIDCVIFDKSGQGFPAVINLGKLDEKGN